MSIGSIIVFFYKYTCDVYGFVLLYINFRYWKWVAEQHGNGDLPHIKLWKERFPNCTNNVVHFNVANSDTVDDLSLWEKVGKPLTILFGRQRSNNLYQINIMTRECFKYIVCSNCSFHVWLCSKGRKQFMLLGKIQIPNQTNYWLHVPWFAW